MRKKKAHKIVHLFIFLGALFFGVLSADFSAYAQNASLPIQSDLGPAMQEMPIVRLRALDKITARAATFDVEVGEVLHFGSLYIKPQSCQKSSPIDLPESASFLQIWEKTILKDETGKIIEQVMQKTHWVFSGWMFASAPGLSYMDHPIYDVWVLDCLDNVSQTPQNDDDSTVLEGEGAVTDQEAADLPEEVEVDPIAVPQQAAE